VPVVLNCLVPSTEMSNSVPKCPGTEMSSIRKGRKDGRKDGSVTISLRNFFGEGIINIYTGIIKI
jgi:hypothetical protein